MATIIENGVSGLVTTDVLELERYASYLIDTPQEAYRLGAGARRVAQERFNIARFCRDWEAAFALVAAQPLQRLTPEGGDHEVGCAAQ